jgi:glycosyltransferase involved in cell wall biosynthesis
VSRPLTVYFLCETYTGYRNYFMRQVAEPEGLPPLYHTWNGYAERGHRVHIFTQDYMYERYEDWSHDGKQLHNIPLPLDYLRHSRDTTLGKALFRVARLAGLTRLRRRVVQIGAEDPPDVIYSCSPWCSLVAWRAATRFRAVHVARRFGTVLYEYMRGKPRLMTDALYVEALCYRLPLDLLVMGNDGTYGDRVARHYGCPRDKLRFWTNGINKELYDPHFDGASFRRRLGFAADTPLILALSRLAGWKRLDRALEVMKYLKATRGDARLLVVGSGEKEGELKALARSLAVDDAVRFLGPIEHREVGDYCNGCDIYLQLFDLTNRCNPLFEAMVCGRPVITMDDPSIDDMITHEKTGLRVKPADIAQAARYIVELLQDHERARRLGAAARNHILQSFQTWPARIEMEVQTVLQLVEKKQRRRGRAKA